MKSKDRKMTRSVLRTMINAMRISKTVDNTDNRAKRFAQIAVRVTRCSHCVSIVEARNTPIEEIL